MSQVSGYKGPGRFLGDRDPGERSQTTWNARGEKHLSYGWKMVILWWKMTIKMVDLPTKNGDFP